MKQLMIIVLSLFFILHAKAQSKRMLSSQKPPAVYQQLKGRWQAENDKNVRLVFSGNSYTALYGKDTTDQLKYSLSSSCKLSDRINDTISRFDENKTVNVLLYEEGRVQWCYELLGITRNRLNWISNVNGKIFVFRRM